MQIVDLSTYPSTKQLLFKTNVDSMEGIFHYSNDKKFIEKLELTNFTIDKKIDKVTYCEITDAIEIHYYRNTEDKFTPDTYELTGCRLNALRILFLDYAINEEQKKCASSLAGLQIPRTSKGSIIVGNP